VGYYLGWAEIIPVDRGIQVSFNPIDCNVCSLAVILPQKNGVLIAHFDVPLIASEDETAGAQENEIVARKADFITEGRVLKRSDSPSLVLLKEGGLRWIDNCSKRSFNRPELTLLTADSLDRLIGSGLFEGVEVTRRRTTEADPFKVLESFRTSALDIPPDAEMSRPEEDDGADLAQPSEQGKGWEYKDIPTLARIWPTNNNVGVSGLCHVLLFYGLGPTDLPSFRSGESALKALTDEAAAVKTFGTSPFIRTRNGLRYLLSNDPVFDSDVGEVHRDQCLATFAALDLPLVTPLHVQSRSYSISDLLSEAVANFDLHEKEPAWTAMALAKYLPPKKEWVNRFRERTTFSQLARLLLRLDPNSQSCAGTHIFQALVKTDQADRRYSILDSETRKQLDSYLTATLRQVVQRQQPDGGWSKQWCDRINNDKTGVMTPVEYRILVTGHLLEVLNPLVAPQRLPNAIYARAAEWLEQALNSKEIRPHGSLLCPFTHAARSAQEILASENTLHLAFGHSLPIAWGEGRSEGRSVAFHAVGRTKLMETPSGKSPSVAILSTPRSSGVDLGETHQGNKQNHANKKRTKYEETNQ